MAPFIGQRFYENASARAFARINSKYAGNLRACVYLHARSRPVIHALFARSLSAAQSAAVVRRKKELPAGFNCHRDLESGLLKKSDILICKSRSSKLILRVFLDSLAIGTSTFYLDFRTFKSFDSKHSCFVKIVISHVIVKSNKIFTFT